MEQENEPQGLSDTRIKSIEFNYEWTVCRSHVYTKQPGDFIKSPCFPSNRANIKCNMFLYPKGKPDAPKDYASLYLFVVSRNPVDVIVEFYVLNSSRAKQHKANLTFHCENRIGHGFPTYIKTEKLFNNNVNFIMKNNKLIPVQLKLTIGCTMTVNTTKAKIKDHVKVFNELWFLSQNKELTDVVLVASGKEFYAHKALLAARSKVFLTMFQTDMKEKKESKVELNDFDSDVLAEMLRYVYTGKVENLEKYVEELLIIADKYLMDGLKLVCEKFFYDNLSIDNAIQTLIVAYGYNCDKLKPKVVDFITDHGKIIITLPQYKELENSEPRIISDLFSALVMKINIAIEY